MRRALLTIVMAAVPLAACSATDPDLPREAAAYRLFPAPARDGGAASYLIGPLDTIGITVFQEPDLTMRDLQVDAAGNIVVPLIGSLHAAGLTTTRLAQRIARRLAEKMLVDPQVSVIVQDSVSQKVTVEGSVIEPGVYELKGPTTLLDALAMAKGPTRVAQLGEVAVFRMVQGRKVGAVFNAKKISRGEASDPEIRGNDTIVVGLSNAKAMWRDEMTASPLAAAIRGY